VASRDVRSSISTTVINALDTESERCVVGMVFSFGKRPVLLGLASMQQWLILTTSWIVKDRANWADYVCCERQAKLSRLCVVWHDASLIVKGRTYWADCVLEDRANWADYVLWNTEQTEQTMCCEWQGKLSSLCVVKLKANYVWFDLTTSWVVKDRAN